MPLPSAQELAKPTPTRLVNAGPLTAHYEKGELRYVRLGQHEVLRRVYVAIRDRNWQTIPIEVNEQAFEASDSSFRIEFEARHELDGILFQWHGLLTGSPDSTIRLEMDGEPKTEFLRNRIGICVLHPVETCSGQPCVVERTDGSTETSKFPELIAPHQPFLNVRALRYPVSAGIEAEVRVYGDEFETEDQRNWSDYTFKTYSTRLSIPFPVSVKPGDRIQQSVELKLIGASPKIPGPRAEAEPIDIRIQPEAIPMPKVGVLYDPQMKAIGNHTRIDIHFENQNWPELLADAARGRTPLEVACLTDDPESDLPRLAAELKKADAHVIRYLLFGASSPFTDPKAISAARTIFGRSAVIAAGSRGNFAELNRNRNIVIDADEVVWPVDPYIHASDYRTVVENLQGQADALRTAKTFSGARSLIVSAVRAPSIETRAGWIGVSLKNLARHGVASITYDLGGMAAPEIGQYLNPELLYSNSSDPLTADALVVRRVVGAAPVVTATLVNFSSTDVQIRIGGQVVGLPALEIASLNLSQL